MTLATASLISTGVLLYLVAGVLFAIVTQLRGIDRSDSDVDGGSWGFRLALMPGLVALWPLLWMRGLKVAETTTPHDRASE